MTRLMRIGVLMKLIVRPITLFFVLPPALPAISPPLMKSARRNVPARSPQVRKRAAEGASQIG